MAADRAGDRHLGRRGDAAVVAAAQDAPFAAELADLDHADAVGCDFLAHLVGVADAADGDRAVRMHGVLVDVFVVHHQQAVLVAITVAHARHREVVHAVVVHADLLFLLGAGVQTAVEIGRITAGERLAPGQDRFGDVAFGDHDGVVAADRHGGESERLGQCLRLRARHACNRGGLGQTGRREHAAGDGKSQTTTENLAPAQARAQDVAEMRVGGAIAVFVVVIAVGFAIWNGWSLIVHAWGTSRRLGDAGGRQRDKRRHER
jgi:hypothetical protein